MQHTSLLLHDICGFFPAMGGVFPSVAAAVFVAAFAGAFAHCAFMCGPFVLAQTGQQLTRISLPHTTELTRLKGAALLPYHAGRITTYTLLGSVAAVFGQGIKDTWAPFGSMVMLLAGAVMILSANSRHIFIKSPAILRRWPAFIAGCGKKHASATTRRGHYSYGMVLGCLPCGMVYAALAAAAATGHVWQGALLMLVFGVATIPALFTVALLGQLGAAAIRGKLATFARISSVAAGLWLIFIGLQGLHTYFY